MRLYRKSRVVTRIKEHEEEQSHHANGNELEIPTNIKNTGSI